MKTYDIIISHHEKIEADSEEDARNRFYDKLERKGLLPASILDSLLKISHQLTFQELIENRMKFGADERKTAIGRQFSLRTIESINRDVQTLKTQKEEADSSLTTLQMVQDCLDNWMKTKKTERNWIDRKFNDEIEEERGKSASAEALSN